VLGVALGGCAAEDGTARSKTDAVATLDTVVAAQGQYIAFPLCDPGQPCGIRGSVDLRLVACSAKISCEPKLLHDPQTLERGPTLVSGFSCGFPDGTPAQDALLAYHPTVRCYRSGDVQNRATWLPVGGIDPALASGEHIFYSQESSTAGDVYTNAAMLMRPLQEAAFDGVSGENGFCEITAWGAVAFSGRDEGPLVMPGCVGEACERKRRGTHVQWAPAIQWRAVVAYDAQTGWRCHASGLTPETWVKRVVLSAATHDLPTPEVKGELPAVQDFALLSVEPRVDLESPVNPGTQLQRVHQSLKLRYAEDSAFPEAPQANPSGMVERDLWTRYPETGPAADVAVSWSCAEVDSAGHVTRLAVLLRDRVLQIPLGALVIDRWDGQQSWSCRPNAQGGCRLFEREEWATLTPCLLPAAPL